MIPAPLAQQIKETAVVEEVVGQFVDLKKKGSRYLGLCPFHNEKTPSFNVTPAMGIYKCFGCGEVGDSVGFLMRHEKLSYPESLKWLAKYYNIEVVEEEATPEQRIEQDERESLAVVQAWALKWSVKQLWNNDEGKRIGLSYFRERGLRDEIIQKFELGFVPESGNAFTAAATEHGFDLGLLEKAGWIKRREDGTGWDFFHGRVTFPIRGLAGQPIAFGARTLKSDKKTPKYFNSPESLLYHKSKSLYGIFLARKEIADQQQCYLVEGYMDVISLHQAGITNVVASSGTSLTVDQIRLLHRYTPTITMLYDGDAAGIKASMRGIDLILAEGMNVKVVLFSDGEDPDSFARSHSSSEVQDYLTTKAQDFILFKTSLLLKDTQGDPVKKSALVHDIVDSIAQVPDHVLRSEYIKRCSSLLEVDEQALLSEMNKELRKRYRKKFGKDNEAPEQLDEAIKPRQTEVESQGTMPQERDIVRMMLTYGEKPVSVHFETEAGEKQQEIMTVCNYMLDLLEEDEIRMTVPLFTTVLELYAATRNEAGEPDLALITKHEDPDISGLAIDLVSDRHSLSANWAERHRIHTVHESDRLKIAIDEAIHILKERRVDAMLRDVMDQLRDEKDDEAVMHLLREQVLLTEAKKALAGHTGRVVVS